MASQRQRREEREDRINVDAGHWATTHTAGSRMTLRVPDGLKRFMPKKEGTYIVSIIPWQMSEAIKKFAKVYNRNPAPGVWDWQLTYWEHRNVGINKERIVCNRKTFGTADAVCELRDTYGNSPKPEDKKLSDGLKWGERQLMLVYDHDDPRSGLQLWEEAFHNFGKQLQVKINTGDEDTQKKRKRFADPEDGLKIVLRGVLENAGSTQFLRFYVDDMIPRKKDDLPKNIFNHGYHLDQIPVELPGEDVHKLLHGLDDEDDRKEDADDRTRPVRDEDRPARGRDERDDDRGRGREEPREERRPARDDDDRRSSRGRDDRDERRPEPAPIKWREGDIASYDYKDEVLTGVIVSLDPRKEIAALEIPGMERRGVADIDKLRPPTRREEEDYLAKKKGRDDDRPARGGRDDDDRGRGRDDDRRASRDDRDDDRPRRGRDDDDDRRPARDDRGERNGDDRPATGRRSARDEWDDDDRAFDRQPSRSRD